MSASRIPRTRTTQAQTTQPRTADAGARIPDAGAPRAGLGLRAVRLGPLSAVVRPRRIVVAVALILVTVLVFAANLGRGDFPLSVPEVLRTLAGAAPGWRRPSCSGGAWAGPWRVWPWALPWPSPGR